MLGFRGARAAGARRLLLPRQCYLHHGRCSRARQPGYGFCHWFSSHGQKSRSWDWFHLRTHRGRRGASPAVAVVGVVAFVLLLSSSSSLVVVVVVTFGDLEKPCHSTPMHAKKPEHDHQHKQTPRLAHMEPLGGVLRSQRHGPVGTRAFGQHREGEDEHSVSKAFPAVIMKLDLCFVPLATIRPPSFNINDEQQKTLSTSKATIRRRRRLLFLHVRWSGTI